MDKSILNDYIDACEFIKETEEEIEKLEKKRQEVSDKVKGSNPEFPYQPQSFGIMGAANTFAEEDLLKREEEVLKNQKKQAKEMKVQVEEWMKDIPFRMQRIIRYKFFNKLSWEDVAVLMKSKSGGEAIRLEFHRFMSKR